MYELKKKIRGALIYPSIVVCSMIGIGVLMMIKVVPTLTQTFTEMKVELPISTQVVIAISDFLVQYTFVSFFALIGIVASVYAAVRTQRGRRVSDFLFLHTPLIGNLVREVNAARTARTLASLISSGVDVLTALDITGEVRRAIREAGIEAGLAVLFIHQPHGPLPRIRGRDDGGGRGNWADERHAGSPRAFLRRGGGPQDERHVDRHRTIPYDFYRCRSRPFRRFDDNAHLLALAEHRVATRG